jgi:hypothetical protein
MKNLYKILGIIAIGALISLGLAGCPMDSGGGGNGGGKPAALSNSATADEALAALDAIIAYSGTPAATKTQAETLKANWSTYSSNWSATGISAITQINIMIDALPDEDNNGGGGNDSGGGDDEEIELPSNYITSPISAEALVQKLAKEYNISSEFTFPEFIKSGGKLFVNGTEVTSGDTMINPNDRVKITPPSGYSGSGNPDDEDDDDSDEEFTPLSLGITSPILAEALVQELARQYGGTDIPSGFTFSDFRDYGGKLSVNGTEVTSGNTMINPSDKVKITPPSGYGGGGNNKND